ncbi:MAG: AAC(3) family N-acetyltransferase [Planctomycetota bacterium]|jgi:aminoglycoside 3-N-acetyltransferase
MNELDNSLKAIGVKNGDCVITHCSFKPFKASGFTPDELIDAVLEVIGEEGTLVMPAFTYSYSGILNITPFNKETTPGFCNGVLSEVFRCRPGVLRSDHPTYSIAAFGKHADYLTANRAQCSPLGHGSSYEDAVELGAKILLLGVRNNRNSMLHYCEVAARLPYNDIPFRQFWGSSALIERDGKVEEVALPIEFPACSENFLWLDAPLVEAGIAIENEVGNVNSFLIDSLKMKDFVIKEIKKKADCLLCSDRRCEPCSLRKKRLRQLGLV